MDWESLERRPQVKKSGEDNNTFKIPVKKVAVTKDQIKTLPDGTKIVVDKPKNPDK